MSDVEVSITGANTDLAFLAVNIGELPQKLTDAAFEIILSRAYMIQGLAQIYVPVKTGNLRDRINVDVETNSDDEKTVSISANTDYASLVEERTPFLGPAVLEVQPELEVALRSLQGSVLDAATK
jgi:hypothetical protein